LLQTESRRQVRSPIGRHSSDRRAPRSSPTPPP